MPTFSYRALITCTAFVAIIQALAGCSGSQEWQKMVQDGVANVTKDYEEALPHIKASHIEKCRDAFHEANTNITLLVRYKLTSPFLPSKTLSCLSRKTLMPQRQPNDAARYISYGAEITATSGLTLKATPNFFVCDFKVENGLVSLQSSQIVADVQSNTLCAGFADDPVQIAY